ncbi:MAG: hypothetical protein QXM31_00325 [Candidatus Woesearchaeota archaeon]
MAEFRGLKGLIVFFLIAMLGLVILIFVLNVVVLLIPVTIVAAIIAWLVSLFYRKKRSKPVVQVWIKKF